MNATSSQDVDAIGTATFPIETGSDILVRSSIERMLHRFAVSSIWKRIYLAGTRYT
jgi:hypothetical protein